MNNKLSVIIPFAQEHPQTAFTVQSIYCELRDRCEFEIITIDNHCDELQYQLEKKQEQRDNGGKYLSELAADRPWLKYLEYKDKLSHWQAKNLGVQHSTGDVLFFCDAHCVPSQLSLWRMYEHYKAYPNKLNGTLHMPLSYMLEKPGLELIYKLVADPSKGIVHYSFSRYKTSHVPYTVPCMSTCGMMITRELYDKLGGWPTELGIYGGGEHFINFTLATLGHHINIFPTAPLYHYAAPRGYSWNYTDYHRNRCIATFMFGGEDWARRYIMNIKPHDDSAIPFKKSILETILTSKACLKHREHLRTRQTKTIETWLEEQSARQGSPIDTVE